MEKSILVLLDTSVYRKSVCELAVWAAKATNAPVRLLHVLDKTPDEIHVPEDEIATTVAEIRNELGETKNDVELAKARLAQKLGQNLMDESRNYLEEQGVLRVETRLRQDNILDAIDFHSKTAYMVIMGKRGEKTAIDNQHLGNNFESVVRASEQPILVASRQVRPIKKVMICFDGEPLIISAINYLVAHPLLKKAHCIVAMAGRADKKHINSFEAAVARLKSAGMQTSSFRSDKSFEKMMSEEVETQNIDMIVMGAFNHSKLHSLMFGSASQEIIFKSRVPVLIMR